MLKRTITFENYDGVTITEDFYFNLSKAEIIKWLTTSGDYTLDKKLERLFKERNGKEIMNIFDELLTISFGKKSIDGHLFDKSEEVKKEFLYSPAYSIIFTELVTDAKKAAEFVNAIIPKDMAEEIEKAMKDNPDGIPDELKDYVPN